MISNVLLKLVFAELLSSGWNTPINSYNLKSYCKKGETFNTAFKFLRKLKLKVELLVTNLFTSETIVK